MFCHMISQLWNWDDCPKLLPESSGLQKWYCSLTALIICLSESKWRRKRGTNENECECSYSLVHVPRCLQQSGLGAGTQLRSPMWVTGTQPLESSLPHCKVCLSRKLVRRWSWELNPGSLMWAFVPFVFFLWLILFIYLKELYRE